MSVWYLLATALAATNVARVRPGLAGSGWRVVASGAIGALLLFVAGAGAVAWAGQMLDALDISPESWRIAAGVIALVAGAWVVAFPVRSLEDGWPGLWSGLVPVAFPLLLTPELAGFLVLFGATEPAASWLPALGLALAVIPASFLVTIRRPNLWAGGSRLLGGLLVVVAIAQIVEGIRDV